jgi:hypothetical protein
MELKHKETSHMERIKLFGVGMGPMMSSALAMMVVLGVVTALTTPATSANVPWSPTVARDDGNRDKSGTSAVQIEQTPSQASRHKDVTHDGAFSTERGRVETAQIHNLLLNLYLRLKARDFKDLARLVDVLSLHGFLPSFDPR